jgi:hypothetical protein
VFLDLVCANKWVQKAANNARWMEEGTEVDVIYLPKEDILM